MDHLHALGSQLQYSMQITDNFAAVYKVCTAVLCNDHVTAQPLRRKNVFYQFAPRSTNRPHNHAVIDFCLGIV